VTATWEKTGQGGQAPWAVMVLASFALHVGGFGLAVALPRLVPRRASGPPVYVVDLVSLPAGPPAARPAPAVPAAAAPAAPPKPERPIRIPERGTRKPEPKKPPAKEAARPPEPTSPKREPNPEPAAAVPDARSSPAATSSPPAAGGTGPAGAAGVTAGGAGGTGGRAADEYTFYLSLLDRRIRGAWKKPIFPLGDPGARAFEARVRVTLTSSGRVVGIDLIGPSGYDALDRSVLRAVQDGQPFPPFPYQIGLDTLTVDVEFALKPGEE
jgi:TonB family protein